MDLTGTYQQSVSRLERVFLAFYMIGNISLHVYKKFIKIMIMVAEIRQRLFAYVEKFKIFVQIAKHWCIFNFECVCHN